MHKSRLTNVKQSWYTILFYAYVPVEQRTYSEHVVSLLAVKRHCCGLMLDGAYGFYAAFPFFLSIPVGESFPIPSATESPSSFEDFYPWTSHFLPTWFLEEWFLVGKNPTLLVVMRMLNWVFLWIFGPSTALSFWRNAQVPWYKLSTICSPG